MITSVEKIYDLYLYQLAILPELHHEAYKEREEARSKHIPTADDLKPETNFTLNRVLQTISNSESFQRMLNQRKIGWQKNLEMIRKIFRKLRNTDEYKEYLRKPKTTYEDDREFISFIYKKFIFDDDVVESWYEELNIHWSDDIFVVNSGILKTIKGMQEGQDIELVELYKDKKEDKEFVQHLFRKTILHSDEYQEWIKNKAQNWELERIAIMDILLMKMALCEVLEFPNIPIKVTLNEYIEISKTFSTPKSNAFINGILDKLVADLRAQGMINKTGRGLIES
jgi:N utilization substance protein B